MEQILIILQVLISVFLIVLVLIQQGKGATMGAAFGSGASQTVFGSQGSGSFLIKLTALFAALFFITSLGLGYLAAKQAKQPAPALIVMPAPMPAEPATVAPVQSTPAPTTLQPAAPIVDNTKKT